MVENEVLTYNGNNDKIDTEKGNGICKTGIES